MPGRVPVGDDLVWSWVRLALGVVLAGVGWALLTWPEVATPVVGLLFALHLLVTGLVRATLSLLVDDYPALLRAAVAVLSLLTAALGVVCLGRLRASAVLMMLVVSIGWLLDGAVAVALGIVDRASRRVWRIGVGVALTMAAYVVLLWPALSLETFVPIGAILLIMTGVGEVALASIAVRGSSAALARER